MVNPQDIKKRQKGMRLNGNLSVNASMALERLCTRFDFGKYAVISAALIAFEEKMRHEENLISPMIQAPRAQGKTASSLETLKKTWCMEFGGQLEGGLCMFNKYEVTLAGETEISRRQVAIGDMPNEKDEMRRYMLGPYQNKYEAERAASK